MSAKPRSFVLAAILCLPLLSGCQGLPHAATPPADRRPGNADVAKPARNVILFLADAGGVSTLSGASLLGYNAPQKLHVQQWPHLGLSDTTPVDEWVSDSANGMSSIVTGVKTRNGVISQGPDAVRGSRDGTPSKTILEYAEERGLLTGVVTTQSIADATPAACYAHANDRKQWGGIFPQAFTPRFGDGVDVLIGAGRGKIGRQLRERGTSFDALAAQYRRPIHAQLGDVPASERRPVVVAERMDVRAATLKALDILEQSPKGYFLMVEWDAHTDDPAQGLQNVVDFDRLVAEVERRVDLDETLLVFTADHSFGFQVDGGGPGQPLLEGFEAWKKTDTEDNEDQPVRLRHVFVNRTHTGEEVAALATGVGAERIHGYFPNTHLFQVMLDAWGWKADDAGR
ncbi:MAG: alkaline phosphatase [Pseudoxanthomonas sp.]|nr:alkaline phosphatase [Pseudoxanthomonas sp.]